MSQDQPSPNKFWTAARVEKRNIPIALHIQALEIKNFRCFRDLAIAFADPDGAELPRLTVLIGENGSGKSALLDAVAAVLRALVRRLFLDRADMPELRPSDVTSWQKAGLELRAQFQIHYEEGPQADPERQEAEQDDDSGVSELLDSASASQFRSRRLELTLGLDAKTGRETAQERFRDEPEATQDERKMTLEEVKKAVLEQAGYLEGQKNLPVLAYYGGNMIDANFSPRHRGPVRGQLEQIYGDGLSPERVHFEELFEWFEFHWKREISQWLKSRHQGQDAGEDPFGDALSKIGKVRRAVERALNPTPERPTYRSLAMGYSDQGEAMTIEKRVPQEEGQEQDRYEAVDLRLLSSGEKGLLVLVADLCRRAIEASPKLDDPFEAQGIVLIDEVDLHLHPKWQRDVLPKLLELFPNFQFIASTHSPFVLGELPARQVRILEESKISVPSATFGRRVDDLAVEIMGAMASPLDSSFAELEQAIAQGDEALAAQKTESIEQTILEKGEDPGINPEIRRAKMALRTKGLLKKVKQKEAQLVEK